ncbi:MAG: hypothetical protein IJ715_02995 [Bacilli bacterium]|nr:hypothetical protein [Bacilli bacterium]
MILYRAINNDDINSLNKYDVIYSSLFNSCLKSKENNKEIRKNVYTYTNLCTFGKRKYALDTIIGHISGKRISAKISPWISVSPDFSLVASEYSIPQSGRYNYSRIRKSIAILDIPDDIIISDKEKLLEIRESDNQNFVVDLRSNNLSKFFECDAIMAEKYNEDMPGYDVVANLNKELYNNKSEVTGFSNFATSVSEMLVFAGIPKKYIKTIISPEVVDIMYACNIDDIDFIVKNNKEIEKIIKDLNPIYIGCNLVDILYTNYNYIKGSNIEEKYNYLLNQKIKELSKMVEYINKLYKKEFKVSNVLDNKIVVKKYDDLNKLKISLKNDLVLIEKDDNPYYHDFDKNGFYSEKLNQIIPIKSVVKKIYTKKRS